MTSITCPRCGATITTRGASHSGQPEGQWECRCGCIVDGGAVYGGRPQAQQLGNDGTDDAHEWCDGYR